VVVLFIQAAYQSSYLAQRDGTELGSKIRNITLTSIHISVNISSSFTDIRIAHKLQVTLAAYN